MASVRAALRKRGKKIPRCENESYRVQCSPSKHTLIKHGMCRKHCKRAMNIQAIHRVHRGNDFPQVISHWLSVLQKQVTGNIHWFQYCSVLHTFHSTALITSSYQICLVHGTKGQYFFLPRCFLNSNSCVMCLGLVLFVLIKCRIYYWLY